MVHKFNEVVLHKPLGQVSGQVSLKPSMFVPKKEFFFYQTLLGGLLGLATTLPAKNPSRLVDQNSDMRRIVRNVLVVE